MSKQVRFHELGDPEVLKLEEHEIGKPGRGEVLVRVEAIGLNRAEAMFRRGVYLEQTELPAGLGYEASGVVEALGEGTGGFSEGDPVSVIPAFSLNAYSVYGEYAIVPVHAVAPRPEGVSAVDAAAVWMAYLTAYGALIDIGGMEAGDAVIIPAASSSVGLAAIQIANRTGAVPIAVTRTADKADAVRQAGAAHVVVSNEQDLAAEVMRITEGDGAALAFDPVAGPGLENLADAMAYNATIFEYGALSGQPTPFPLIRSLQKGLSVRGYTLFEVTGDPERFERGKVYVNEGLETGAFRPTIARTFGLDDIVEAHRYLESNQQFGKIVVTVP